MSDNGTSGTLPGSLPTSLSPLPPPPKDRPGGYKWAFMLIGIVWLGLLVMTGSGWLKIFSYDPSRAAGWWFFVSLAILTPACLLLWLVSCAIIAGLRRLGARTWPAALQALPAVVAVVTVAYLLLVWIFRDRTP